MRVRVTVAMFLMLVGCQTVHVSVNSLRNSDKINRLTPIIFPKSGADIEVEKLRKMCAKGAVNVGMNVTMSCKDQCYWVHVEGATGQTTQSVESRMNPYTKQQQIYSSEETQRKIKLSIYADQDSKQLIYQALLDSSGSSNNVLSVAEEMCEAGFRAFPDEFTSKTYRIEAK